MYCDDTVVCVKDLQAILTVLNIFKSFADFSGLKINTSKSSIIDNSESRIEFGIPLSPYVQYLRFKFDKNGLVNQAINFLNDLPQKYLKVRKLNLSPIDMGQFVNSYVLSKVMFWTQAETTFESE
eukprot:TRINITY_DN3091_c0_g1_i32.p1 TRINITY_DN3091_c0_g1~~TRINITY_DN3091_c0_g1_i32.p1  ORF type:complete len:125 (-),score=6.52 TRINITY_DN3091_c0_g1_i32:382-756(-)